MSESFVIPRVNVIESSLGFSVEMFGRTGLVYRRGADHLEIYSELLLGPAGVVVYAETIREWDEPAGRAISSDEKAKIIDDLRRAFRFQGFEIHVIDPTDIREL